MAEEVNALDGISGTVNRDVQKAELVTLDGKAYIKTAYSVDFGEKNGTARVTVLDPCVSAEAQEKRRQAILKTCEDLIRRGLM